MVAETDIRSNRSLARVVVAIPCLNEAAAIQELVRHWRRVLPEAEIVVFDNASTDGTAAEARLAGAVVELVPTPGKGHVIQAIFERYRDRAAVLITDGDGTYPPERGLDLLEPVLDGRCEMSVGRRCPVAVEGSPGMAPVRWVGNRLLRFAFRCLIGRGPGDFLSGYRVFSPRMLREIQPRSAGFEIETELAGEAVTRGYRVLEIDVPYYPRVAGTQSKLRAGRDGLRIICCMFDLAARQRLYRVLLLVMLGLIAIVGLVRLFFRVLG